VRRGLRALIFRRSADREVADEVRDYFEQAVDAMVARGLPPDEARRAARLELGEMTTVAERVRTSGWENVVGASIADLRFAARQLRAAPGFTAVTVLTLALGVGATTAIFSAVDPILFEPLPYRDAGRIVTIWETRTERPRTDGTFGMYSGLAARTRAFESMAVFKSWQPALTGADQPERLEGQRVSAEYFHVLGVSPALGRDFRASDDRRGAPNVVILSDRLWRRRFARDPAIVGRQVVLDDSRFDTLAQRGSHLVIGVMPPGFENVLAPSAELWTPLQYDLGTQYPAWGHHLRTVGRLRAGVSVVQATSELDRLGPVVLEERHPDSYRDGVKFIVSPLQEDLTRGVRPALLAVLGAVILVLVIAGVNVTNLLLARGVHRRGEFALRAALGAGRSRLVRQLLTESLLLAAMGGAVGFGVAVLGVRALVALSPADLPRAGAIGVNAAVFAVGLGITTLVGLTVGLIPAVHAARTGPHPDIQQASGRAPGGHGRARRWLVVTEVALALVLLVGSGLLLRSLEHLFSVEPGFDAAHLLTMQVQTSGHRFDDAAVTRRFFDEVLEAVRHVPGVTSAALTSQLPLSGELDEYGVHFESSPAQRSDEDHGAFRYTVSPGYIETMHIPLRRGRLLDERDRAGAPLAALLPESYARREFPGVDPVGQRLRIGANDGPDLYTVVGVVGDVRQVSLAVSRADAVYVAPGQWHFADSVMWLVVRTRGDAAALGPAVRRAVWSVDKDQPVVRVATMDGLLAASAAERRFALILFEAFALAALALAAAGIYGVLAGSVAERTREIGVRAALGAPRRSIVALVVRQGMTLSGVGVAIGLAAAPAASQAVAAMLFGVSRLDPVTYVGVVALLLAVSAAACSVPAWRATRVDPARTLRAE
jgi:putative ABC transport system permease protein